MYPTARMIFVALAGIPLALVAAAVAPSFWLVGCGWIVFSIGIFMLDTIVAAPPSSTTISLHVPQAIGIGRTEPAHAEIHFGARAPSGAEFAIDTNGRLAAEPHRLPCPVKAGTGHAEFSLQPIRRGEGLVEGVWVRWRGPLGLCWRQSKSELRASVAIVPNIAQIKEDAVRLLRRESDQVGLRAQLRTGEGAEFNALKEFQNGMDRRMIDWKQSARHGKLLVREFQAARFAR